MNRIIIFTVSLFVVRFLNAQPCALESEIAVLKMNCSTQNSASDSVLQNLNKLSFLYIKHGNIDEAVSLNDFVIKSLYKNGIKVTPALTGALDVKGHILYSVNDIEEAKRVWELSLSVKRRFFSNRKGLLAESYSNLARCFNYMIAIDSAMIYSSEAVELINSCSIEERNKVNAPEILRTYVYAYKIYYMRGNEKKTCIQVAAKLDSIAAIPHPWLNYYLPDFIHDKANAFTDLALHFRDEPSNKNPDRAFSEYCYIRAQELYDRELYLRNKFNDNPNPLSTLYFTKALVQKYTFGNTIDNNLNCLSYANQSIQILNENNVSGKLDRMFFKTGKLNVMMFKSDFLINLYLLQKKKEHLNELYANTSAAYEVYIDLINNLKTDKLGSVFEVYNLFQFDALIFAELELYKLTGNKKYLTDAFCHSQQSRYLDLLASRKEKQNSKYNEQYFIDGIQKNIFFTKYTRHVFLDYYSSYYNPFVIFIVSNGELNYYTGTKPDFSDLSVLANPEFINDTQDSVYIALNSLYNSFIKPVCGYMIGKRFVHISSKADFCNVPFDALLPDLKNKNHFFGDEYNIQNRFSLLINPLFRKDHFDSNVAVFTVNPSYKKYPDLLFNRKLCDDLKHQYDAVSANHLKEIENSNPYILQISAHGYFDSSIMKPALLLNDSAVVTYSEIENLLSTPIIACLIMCESGKGVLKMYEGSDNLGRSFAVNGTPAVITSLWKADDKASALIMSSFYRFLSEGYPVHAALVEAKALFRKEHPEMAHPFYWASIQCTGDNLTVSLKSTQRKNQYFVLAAVAGSAVLAGLLLLVFLRRRKKLSQNKK
ncbi:MAG: hypothetical protein A2W93_06360 [Bacteroidetes bacterium GWF2_43_63]|nr:MAG: hypothetical protein A2W94_08175 [Bacteroidetes bacterium GWE2_42_42]OFY53243.1 MAG: hypothetical protein A2W93_06360 [Bacteroidetes bacterium GWF2_43_63]HBG71765.1 hypothetical protein [Bacteroidales bacterium]HCB61570.1 hypothetical protein [Bacteroidales bacterium]HCY22782.1 hypothetical protein [Bacteroidales bacterium]